MPDIYDILSKHFLNETTEEEEQKIKAFKTTNAAEYSMLKRLWEKGDIRVKDFDSHKAWAKMELNLKKAPQTKVVKLPVYKRMLQVAAVAAILIIGAYTAYYFTDVLPGQQIVTVASGTAENAKEIILSDGTVVWLNKNSTLAFTKKFSNNKREVYLTGEAFFKVHRDTEKPFIISTDNASVKVLGTSFNVKSNADITKVVVATGKVKVSNSEGNDFQIITPGLSAEVSGEKVIKYKTSSPNYLAWKTGVFKFHNTPLPQVIDDLNTYYNNKFVLNSTEETACRLTADFNKAEINDILETIKLTCDVEINQKNGKYILKN